jgi:hypothetical protein
MDSELRARSHERSRRWKLMGMSLTFDNLIHELNSCIGTHYWARVGKRHRPLAAETRPLNHKETFREARKAHCVQGHHLP